MKTKPTYGQDQTASKLAGPSDHITVRFQRIEERNRAIKEKKAALALKEQEIQMERKVIAQIENENLQDLTKLMDEIAACMPSQNRIDSSSGLRFDWNPQYNLEIFLKLLSGEIPRTRISISLMDFDDFKSAFTVDGAISKEKINCINLKLFVDILFFLMRKRVVLIEESLLEHAIIARCLHRSRPVDKVNLQRYASLSRTAMSKGGSLFGVAEEILRYLDKRKIES